MCNGGGPITPQGGSAQVRRGDGSIQLGFHSNFQSVHRRTTTHSADAAWRHAPSQINSSIGSNMQRCMCATVARCSPHFLHRS